MHPLDVTTPRDSYAWNYREPATLHPPLGESLAESALEPLAISSEDNILTNCPGTCLRFKVKYSILLLSPKETSIHSQPLDFNSVVPWCTS